MEATNTEIFGPTRFVPESGSGRDCVISRRDLEILMHGSEIEREKGHRNLASAVAGGAGLGVASTLTSHFGELLTVGLPPAETLFLVLMLSTTMASGVMAVFFHRRVRRAGAGHRRLNEQIRDQLDTAEEDLLHWP